MQPVRTFAGLGLAEGGKVVIKKIIFILILLALVSFITWFAIGCFTKPPDTTIKTPDAATARYSVHIVNTGELLYSDNIEVYGAGDDETYILNGYFEVQAGQFTYKPRAIILQESIMGEIRVRERQAK